MNQNYLNDIQRKKPLDRFSFVGSVFDIIVDFLEIPKVTVKYIQFKGIPVKQIKSKQQSKQILNSCKSLDDVNQPLISMEMGLMTFLQMLHCIRQLRKEELLYNIPEHFVEIFFIGDWVQVHVFLNDIGFKMSNLTFLYGYLSQPVAINAGSRFGTEGYK